MFSQEFRNNWGHFFWVGLLALALTAVSGGPTLLPWLALLEVVEFAIHAFRNHPEHPLLKGNRFLWTAVTCLLLGIVALPMDYCWILGMKLPGVLTAVRLCPLFAVQHTVSKWIHDFVHGVMEEECRRDPVLFAAKLIAFCAVLLGLLALSVVLPAVL